MYNLRFLVTLLTFFVLILTRSQLKNSPILWYYLLGSFITDIVSIMLRSVFESNYYGIVGITFMVFEFVLFMFYFVKNGFLTKRMFISITIIGLLIVLMTQFSSIDNLKIKPKAVALSLIFPMFISIYCYYSLLKITPNLEKDITQYSFFWGITAIFVYSSVSVIFWITRDYQNQYGISIRNSMFLFFLFFVALKTVLIYNAFQKKQ